MNKKLNRVYLCYKFDGIYDNAKKIIKYINKLVEYNKNTVYISPILLFGSIYDKLTTDEILEYRLSILKDCDLMIDFKDNSDTEDCEIERKYCGKHNIKIVEFTDYFKKNLGVDI